MKALESKHLGAIFILGTIITYGTAWYLWRRGNWPLAASVIWWSPFPCPPGVPC